MWTDIVIGMIVLTLFLYYWFTSTFNYWKTRGVAGPRPVPIFGNTLEVIRGKISIGEYTRIHYEANRDQPMYGIFEGHEPILVLVDLDLVKDVLIRDFAVFPERGWTFPDFVSESEPLFPHLFNLKSAQWKPLRNRLRSIFTSGKLKNMLYLIIECGGNLEEYLASLTAKNDTVECRDLMSRFTIDVAGRIILGLQTNAFTDEDSEFRKIGQKLLEFDWWKIVKGSMRNRTPWLYNLLGSFFHDTEISDFFLRIMRDTADYRKKNNIVTHDFIDLLMSLRDNPDDIGEVEFTDSMMSAQLFVFFLAGYESTSSTTSHALYELAQNQQIQDKVRNEILTVIAENDGKITYEGINSMEYLHLVFQETLRMYPIGLTSTRKCVEDYTFSGTKLRLEKGSRLIIPTFAIHRDARIYPNPDVFDPERFRGEAIKNRHSLSWIPFSDGPRNCIGGRLANFQTKIGLIKVLEKYKVEVCDKTQIPYIIDTKAFTMTPSHGIHLKMSKVN